MDKEAIRKEFREKFPVSHYYCEDSWYSCPLSEEGCADDSKSGCCCGAEEEQNERLAYLIEKMEEQENKYKAIIEDYEEKDIDVTGHEYALELVLDALGLPRNSTYDKIPVAFKQQAQSLRLSEDEVIRVLFKCCNQDICGHITLKVTEEEFAEAICSLQKEIN